MSDSNNKTIRLMNLLYGKERISRAHRDLIHGQLDMLLDARLKIEQQAATIARLTAPIDISDKVGLERENAELRAALRKIRDVMEDIDCEITLCEALGKYAEEKSDG